MYIYPHKSYTYDDMGCHMQFTRGSEITASGREQPPFTNPAQFLTVV